jgi:hypothetical protein
MKCDGHPTNSPLVAHRASVVSGSGPHAPFPYQQSRVSRLSDEGANLVTP